MPLRAEKAAAHRGQEVETRGWLYNKRSSGKIHFLLIRDGSGILQAVVAKQDVSAEVFASAETLTQESSLIVRGMLREDRRGPGATEPTAAAPTAVRQA